MDVAIRVTLPGNGFLGYVYNIDETRKTLTLATKTDKPRTCNFRVFVPGPVESVRWNDESALCDITLEPGSGSVVVLKRSFKNGRLQIKVATFRSACLPEGVCSSE